MHVFKGVQRFLYKNEESEIEGCDIIAIDLCPLDY